MDVKLPDPLGHITEYHMIIFTARLDVHGRG
jgi:hypothetical protein